MKLLGADAYSFLTKIDFVGECWVWTGSKEGNGYPRFQRFYKETKEQYAHRIAYLSWIGPIPDDRELDHKCRNRSCVNPTHLEVVTHTENMLRGEYATKTHCCRGHEFRPGSFRWETRPNGRSKRCIQCKVDYDARRYARSC